VPELCTEDVPDLYTPDLYTEERWNRFSTDQLFRDFAGVPVGNTREMTWADVFRERGVRIASREQLIASGATGRILTDAVRGGDLVRARRDHYALPSESTDVLAAIRVGGLVDCVSALAGEGIFAFDHSRTHVRIEHEMSRMRATRSRFIPLTDQNRADVNLHWWSFDPADAATEFSVGIEDALSASLRCQAEWHALASLDNAIHLDAISRSKVDRLFGSAPDRVQHLRRLIDGRAESGQESVLRMIVVEAGLDFDLQVSLPEVGRVDLIVEGCLVLEADSRLAHDGWEHHIYDRRRDLLLARDRYMSLRPAYQHTMFEPDLVRASIMGLLQQSRNFRRSFS
jgi:hypothetical protein